MLMMLPSFYLCYIYKYIDVFCPNINCCPTRKDHVYQCIYKMITKQKKCLLDIHRESNLSKEFSKFIVKRFVQTNMSRFIYPILTLGLASFVTYSGYCVYKHSKQKICNRCPYNLFETRLIEIVHKEASRSKSYIKLCELSTPVTRRDYFMKKVQAANDCISSGDHDTSIELLIRAMAVCSRPAALLQCMSTTLPINVYRKLIQRLSNLT